MIQSSTVHSTATTLGFWAAILTVVFTVAFIIATFVFITPNWEGIESYAHSFNTLQMISVIPPMFFAITLIVVMVALHYCVAENQRIYSLLGIAFSIIYAVVISSNAYLQLFVVRLNLINGQLEGLSILAMPNLRSVFFALEALGYCFLSIALLAVSPVFQGGRLTNWIRILFIIIGAVGIYGLIIALFDNPVLILGGLGLWNLLYPISMILISIYFKKENRTLRNSVP